MIDEGRKGSRAVKGIPLHSRRLFFLSPTELGGCIVRDRNYNQGAHLFDSCAVSLLINLLYITIL